MLQLLSISNLGFKGINTDAAPWDLPPDAITDGINFRIFTNQIVSTGASELWATLPVDINAGFIMRVSVPQGDFWLIAGRTAVYAYDGATFSDVSVAGGYPGIVDNGEFDWVGAMLGSIPVINNPGGYPEFWSPVSGSTNLQPLLFSPGSTWQAEGKSCEVMRSHKNFLFALNMTENGVNFPSAYRWSNPADINGLPFTWDESDLSGIAGRAQIGGDAGTIIDGRSLRDAFCIYAERGISILELSGDEFIWRRRELSTTHGLLNKNCIAEVKGSHFFLSDGDIFKNDGNTVTSIVQNRIKQRINSSINAAFFHRSYVVRNTSFKEVWFCVPEGVAEFPNTAYIYNWFDDSWAIRSLPDNISYADYGPQSNAPITWDNVVGSWDSTLLTWGSQNRTPLDETVIGINQSTGDLVALDPLDSGQSGNISARIERTDLAIQGHRTVTSILRVYPHMTGTVPVNIQIGSQEYAGAPIKWSPETEFNPSMDRKLDIRSTGPLHAWRVINVGTGTWSISGMDFEWVPAGDR